MKRFVEGQDRSQLILLPDCLDDYVGEDNPVRIVDAFIDELDLAVLGFAGVIPEVTGRPSYHPVTLLKIYLYGYLNRVQSSRQLERETQRNIELMWLTGRLMPDFKTIADFRRDNVREWQNRPLDPLYPVIFFDALRVKIRDEGLVRNKAVYVALALNSDGEKEVLGLWIEQTEGAKFWLKVMNELKTRGVNDVLIAVVDGL